MKKAALIVAAATFLPRAVAVIVLGDRVLEPRQDQYIFAELAKGVRDGRGLALDPARYRAKADAWDKSVLREWVREPSWAFGLVPVGRRTSAYEPLYPYTLGMALRLGLGVGFAARAVNLVFAVAGALAAWGLGRRIFGETGGVLAGVGVGWYPLYFYYGLLVMGETAHVAALTLWLAVLSTKGEDRAAAAAAAGVTAAVFFLVRAIALPVVVLTAAVMGWGGRRKDVISYASLTAAVFAVALIPWASRNYDLHGTWVVAPSRGGVNLWMRNNPEVLALEPGELGGRPLAYWLGRLRRPELLRYPDMVGLNEVERDRVLMARAAAFIRANPVLFARLCGIRLVNTVRPFGPLVTSPWHRAAAAGPYAAILLFGAIGAAASIRRGFSREAAALLLLFLFYVAYHAIIHGGVRYRLPGDVGLIILAGGGAGAVGRRLIKVCRPARVKDEDGGSQKNRNAKPR